MREPHVSADDAVVANAGVAAENGGAGIDGDVVLNIRMALVGEAANQVSVCIAAAGGIERAEGHAVIERHMLADGGGFSDDHAGAVIDKKGFVEFCAGMNIDAGVAMRSLSHHSRQIWHLQKI
jgi:hypothetical protein